MAWKASSRIARRKMNLYDPCRGRASGFRRSESRANLRNKRGGAKSKQIKKKPNLAQLKSRSPQFLIHLLYLAAKNPLQGRSLDLKRGRE